MFGAFHVSLPGAGHLADGRPMQDWSGMRRLPRFAVVAVADGHGGAKYARSDEGAKLAVRSAIATLAEFFLNYPEVLRDATEREAEARLQHLERVVINAWRTRVAACLKRRPPGEAELAALGDGDPELLWPQLYGTTLLFAALTPHCGFASQIGDGRCVALNADGAAFLPVPEDERLGFGLTTSLCDKAAANHFRRFFTPEPPKALILATDGVADSYTPESLGKFAATLVENHEKSPARTERRLAEWLARLSEQGSRDDVSVAGAYRKR